MTEPFSVMNLVSAETHASRPALITFGTSVLTDTAKAEGKVILPHTVEVDWTAPAYWLPPVNGSDMGRVVGKVLAHEHYGFTLPEPAGYMVRWNCRAERLPVA